MRITRKWDPTAVPVGTILSLEESDELMVVVAVGDTNRRGETDFYVRPLKSDLAWTRRAAA